MSLDGAGAEVEESSQYPHLGLHRWSRSYLEKEGRIQGSRGIYVESRREAVSGSRFKCVDLQQSCNLILTMGAAQKFDDEVSGRTKAEQWQMLCLM